MKSRIRSTFLCSCLVALAAPAGAAAGTVPVAPPGSGGGESLSTAATTAVNPGCRSRNIIAFKRKGTFRKGQFKGMRAFKVRHAGRIRCENVRVRIRCNANLLKDGERISSERSVGANRCRVGTRFAESKRYPKGTQFVQNYRYKLTLKNKRQRWRKPTADCPKRSKNRRTLTCRGSHATVAPTKSVDTIRS